MFRRLRRWWFNRKNPMVAASEMLLQKSGALEFRRDPCAPGGCILQPEVCEACARRLYECEARRSVYPPAVVRGRSRARVCAACFPFEAAGTPDGFLAHDVCSHGQPLWQSCLQCKAADAPPDDSLQVER